MTNVRKLSDALLERETQSFTHDEYRRVIEYVSPLPVKTTNADHVAVSFSAHELQDIVRRLIKLDYLVLGDAGIVRPITLKAILAAMDDQRDERHEGPRSSDHVDHFTKIASVIARQINTAILFGWFSLTPKAVYSFYAGEPQEPS